MTNIYFQNIRGLSLIFTLFSGILGILIGAAPGLIGAEVICGSAPRGWLIVAGVIGAGVIVAGIIICGSAPRGGLMESSGNRSWGSNLAGILGINRERRDCLSVGAFTTYGNGSLMARIRFASEGAKMYSSLATKLPLEIKLNPNWITGFVDGEGSFIISIQRNLNKIG